MLHPRAGFLDQRKNVAPVAPVFAPRASARQAKATGGVAPSHHWVRAIKGAKQIQAGGFRRCRRTGGGRRHRGRPAPRLRRSPARPSCRRCCRRRHRRWSRNRHWSGWCRVARERRRRQAEHACARCGVQVLFHEARAVAVFPSEFHYQIAQNFLPFHASSTRSGLVSHGAGRRVGRGGRVDVLAGGNKVSRRDGGTLIGLATRPPAGSVPENSWAEGRKTRRPLS